MGVQRAEQWDLDQPFWTFTGQQAPGRYRNSLSSNDVFDDEGNKYRVVGTANYRVLDDGSLEVFKNSLVVIPRN